MLCRCPWRQKPESGDHCFKVSPVWENVKPPLSAGGWALIMEVRWISHKLLNILLKLLVATNHKTSGYTAAVPPCPGVMWVRWLRAPGPPPPPPPPPSLSLLLYDGGTSAAAALGHCIYHSTLGAKFAACTALAFDRGACRCILKCQESEDS